MKEISKGLVVLELLLLHWYDILDVRFESPKVVHQKLLLFYEFINVLCVLCKKSFRHGFKTLKLDVLSVMIQQEISISGSHCFKRVHHLSLRPEKDLDLLSRSKVWGITKLLEELVKKVCSFLDEDVLLVTSGLLWGNRWNVKAWISSKEHVSDHVEFSVPPEYIDVAKTIIAFDMVLNVCLPSRLSLLLCDDF